LDAQAITMLDSTAALVLEDIRADIEQRGLKLGIANLHGQPRSLLVNAGFLTKIGPEMVFNRVEDAAFAFEQGRP
jgi:MFS superfamily sulfate permease-like transporter